MWIFNLYASNEHLSCAKSTNLNRRGQTKINQNLHFWQYLFIMKIYSNTKEEFEDYFNTTVHSWTTLYQEWSVECHREELSFKFPFSFSFSFHTPIFIGWVFHNWAASLIFSLYRINKTLNSIHNGTWVQCGITCTSSLFWLSGELQSFERASQCWHMNTRTHNLTFNPRS